MRIIIHNRCVCYDTLRMTDYAGVRECVWVVCLHAGVG